MAEIDITPAGRRSMAIEKRSVEDKTYLFPGPGQRLSIPLVSLDLDGPTHRNPDGAEIPCPHLHIYREGFADKWAIPAPTAVYPDRLDLFETFEAFVRHCNVTEPPVLEKRLFS